MSKYKWKKEVKEKVRKYAIEEMNKDGDGKKWTKLLLPYERFSRQLYFSNLSPQKARIVFKIRAGVLDIKAFRRYKYSDTICRLCGDGEEDIDHIASKCKEI